MSGKIKSRSAANADSVSGSVSCGERILRDCHQIYIDPESGLITIAQTVGVSLLPPRKKITVMLMGNHSAGKSSFINWYVEEHIQRTGVAIETQGFSFVTSGRKRESLTGNATLHLYPHFKPLQEFKGLSEYLGTEICTSRQKRFSLVTFVDTPGLVDGDMKYPFDVDQAILWLGELCDLILVFFDPMGQALCKRTLNIVEKLNEKQGDRLRFYLSKADEAGGETQQVWLRHFLTVNPSRCVNQIEEVCRTIEKTINQTVQNTLNSLEKDCNLITEAITETLHNDRQCSIENRRSRFKGCLLGMLGFTVPLLLLVTLVLGSLSKDVLVLMLGDSGIEALTLYVVSMYVYAFVCISDEFIHCAEKTSFSILLNLSCSFSLYSTFRTKPTLSGKQKRQLQQKLEYVQEVVKTKKKNLYEEYLRQSVGDQDMN
uniref:Si:ch211-11k18.4 n=1 Tax=Cyprinus carpio TaxID=7962 RepID=A0A8C2HNV2_CYPCA